MGFWIFVTICNFLIPFLMIVFGVIFVKNPPTSINGIYGYRTSMSRKNQETWDFAQLYFGKLWWKTGLMMFPVTIIVMLPVIKMGAGVIEIWGAIVEVIQGAVMVVTIILVEMALKTNFDKEGRKRNGE